jgi:hypothetical protein
VNKQVFYKAEGRKKSSTQSLRTLFFFGMALIGSFVILAPSTADHNSTQVTLGRRAFDLVVLITDVVGGYGGTVGADHFSLPLAA